MHCASIPYKYNTENVVNIAVPGLLCNKILHMFISSLIEVWKTVTRKKKIRESKTVSQNELMFILNAAGVSHSLRDINCVLT